MIKQKLKYKLHIQLNQLFLSLDLVETVIEFIYKNIYELIDEIPYIEDEFGVELRKNYRQYYSEVITRSEEEWLKTLFPNPELSFDISFKKLYVGIVGRLIFLANTLEDYCWYGDPMNWDLSYTFEFENDNSGFTYKNCQFIVLKNYSEFQVEDESYSGLERNHSVVIYKTLI